MILSGVEGLPIGSIGAVSGTIGGGPGGGGFCANKSEFKVNSKAMAIIFFMSISPLIIRLYVSY
jgi:hypothetical protein